MSKIFYYDLETTGTDYKENGIHQISAILEVDGEIKKELNLFCAPYEGCKTTKEALEVGGVTIEQLNAYPPEIEAYRSLQKELNQHCDKFDSQDKFFLCGFNNVSFDNNFLRKLWERQGDNYFGSFFWANSLDVMILASLFLKDTRHKMDNFKLSTVAKALGVIVNESKLHDAFYDLYLTREIMNLILNGVQTTELYERQLEAKIV